MLHTLSSVSQLRFIASSDMENAGWNGEGRGDVEVVKQENVVVFNETGSWTTSEGTVLMFKNSFRWTHIPEREAYQLEHLRFGPDNPVFLFELVPTTDGGYISETPHLCGADTYAGALTPARDGFTLLWTIRGPKKDEKIMYEYF